MKKTIADRILSFLPERKERIKKGDMIVLDLENNIYFYRLGQGKIPLGRNENIFSDVSISSIYGKDYGLIRTLEDIAKVTSITLECKYKMVYDHGLKCKEAIMLY